MTFIGLFVSLFTNSFALNDPTKELKPIPKKLVVLTFDDCNKSDRTFVADIIKQHGFGATFYVTEGLGFLNNKAHYTTWEEIRELHDMGFEIGNHTKAHRDVRSLTKQQLHASLDHIDVRCAQLGIPKPVTFCYPGFSHNLQAVEVLDKNNYLFARRGVSPEYGDGGRGGPGPAYDPKLDHPLLVPTTWYSGPDSGFEDMKWAVSLAKYGKIAVLCFHGVPALEHPWVNTEQQDFIRYMKYLKQSGCTVISMRELTRYVDPSKRPEDPYAITRTRASLPLKRAQNAKANHALKDAARLGNIEDVKQHLEAGADVNTKDKTFEWTPLQWAVFNGHKEVAVLLIGKGAHVNTMDERGHTPLHSAVQKSRKEIAELLITNAADINRVDKAEGTPLDVAILFKHPKIADLLRKHGGKTKRELEAEGK